MKEEDIQLSKNVEEPIMIRHVNENSENLIQSLINTAADQTLPIKPKTEKDNELWKNDKN